MNRQFTGENTNSKHTYQKKHRLTNNQRNSNWNKDMLDLSDWQKLKSNVWESLSLHIFTSRVILLLAPIVKQIKRLYNKRATEHWEVIYLCEFPKCILGALPTHYPHISINHRMGASGGVGEEKECAALHILYVWDCRVKRSEISKHSIFSLVLWDKR